jgi:hypothetical protein
MTSLAPLAPCLALCALFYSSTLFSEDITARKYPAYAAYRRRVAMFVPLLTPVHGAVLALRGEKAQVDAAVWGQGDVKKLTE